MYKWFKENDIARKLVAVAEDLTNSGNWAPFEGLEGGEVTVKVTHRKGVIRFEKSPLQEQTDKSPFTIADELIEQYKPLIADLTRDKSYGIEITPGEPGYIPPSEGVNAEPQGPKPKKKRVFLNEDP